MIFSSVYASLTCHMTFINMSIITFPVFLVPNKVHARVSYLHFHSLSMNKALNDANPSPGSGFHTSLMTPTTCSFFNIVNNTSSTSFCQLLYFSCHRVSGYGIYYAICVWYNVSKSKMLHSRNAYKIHWNLFGTTTFLKVILMRLLVLLLPSEQY